MAKKAAKPKFKRAPGAPKRFKSAFMFYSESQHKLIRNNNPNKKIRAADVAKIVSQSWKNLGDTERAYWNDIANRDRQRFEREKAGYNGPWKVPDVKDPNAPKKPMSAFLAFGNERRKAIAEANPTLSNTEISHLLSKLWRECPDHIKQHYRDREAREREQFKKIRAEWERQKKERESRESSPTSEMFLPPMAGSSQHQAIVGDGAAFCFPSMAGPVAAVSPNRVPIVHPISAFPPGKVNGFAAQQQPLFHQQTGKVEAAAAAGGNNSITTMQTQMKLPPMNSGFDTSLEGIAANQDLRFGALRRLSDFSSLDPTPMRPFQTMQVAPPPMHQPSMQLANMQGTTAPTQGTTTTAAEAEITIEDAEDLLGEEDDYGPDDDPTIMQANAHFYPQQNELQNMPMACPSIPTFPSPALQQLQPQVPYNPSQVPSIEQMLDYMSQHHPTVPLQLQNASLLSGGGGTGISTADTQRMAELARELGDDAVSMLIGTFR